MSTKIPLKFVTKKYIWDVKQDIIPSLHNHTCEFRDSLKFIAIKRLFGTSHKIGLSNTDNRNKCLNSTNAGLKVTQDSFAALPATDFTASCTRGQCGRNMLRVTQWPQVESRSTQPDDCGSEKATSSSGQIGRRPEIRKR